jgi:hypothetical protein
MITEVLYRGANEKSFITLNRGLLSFSCLLCPSVNTSQLLLPILCTPTPYYQLSHCYPNRSETLSSREYLIEPLSHIFHRVV